MGRLTTHVLDTSRGRPAAGMTIELYNYDAEVRLVHTAVTNADGRTDEPLLAGESFQSGVWELVFAVGDYFRLAGEDLADPPFLDRVPIRFGIAGDRTFHVPLLVTPWGYSTYRGS
jgi:5-hydroxyisourate hydrolase